MQFDFTDLIEEHSVNFVAEIPAEGYYDDFGDFITGKPTRKTMRGAIISHRESKIFRSGGTLTGQDRALYMLEPLENALQMARIFYEGIEYRVGDMLENSEFTGVWAYTLKYVSAFKETDPEYNITNEYEKLSDRLDGTLTEDTATETELTSVEELERRLNGIDD